MAILNLIFLFKIILSIFFLIKTYFFSTQIVHIVVDKSFGDINNVFNYKINHKKVVAKSWYFLFFVISFFYGIYTITSSKDEYVNISGLIAVLFLMISFHYIPKKIIKNNYYKKYESIKTEKKIDELKPTSLTNHEIKEKFDLAIKNKYFDCELIDFENLLHLKEPETKIIWLTISENNTTKKDKQMLIDFLHPLFSKGLHKIHPRKKVSFFINKYFEFNQINHPTENPFKDDIIGDWSGQTHTFMFNTFNK